MIIAGAAIVRKVKKERAKKKESEQGLLSVGDNDVARRAFASQSLQASKALQSGDSGIQRTGTEIKFEDPSSLDVTSPTASSPGIASPTPTSPGITSPRPQIRGINLAPTPRPEVASPVQSEQAFLAASTPATDVAYGFNRSSRGSSMPPPFSPSTESSTQSPSVYSRDSDGATLATSDTSSVLASSSQGTYAVRVRTNGADLKSGFQYHPALFDLRVHPQKWDDFTGQIVDTTKFGIGDHAQVVATATAVAMTGAWATSVFVGRGMNRRIQETKVKAGLTDMSDGGLGDILKQWNESYFRGRGLFVHLELSESAMKHPDQKSKIFRKEAHWYGKEDRDRKRAERKFVLVVTRLDEDGEPSEALHELAGGNGVAVIPELASEEDARYNIAEMPGDEGSIPVELPGDMVLPAGVSLGYGNEKLESPFGFAELESDTTMLLGKTRLDDESAQELEAGPLMVTGSTHEALHKEIT